MRPAEKLNDQVSSVACPHGPRLPFAPGGTGFQPVVSGILPETLRAPIVTQVHEFRDQSTV
jgi:hypothetical protein